MQLRVQRAVVLLELIVFIYQADVKNNTRKKET